MMRCRSKEVGKLTYRVDAEGRRIRERWASPRGVRFFANAVHEKKKNQHSLRRSVEDRGTVLLTSENADMRARSRSVRAPRL